MLSLLRECFRPILLHRRKIIESTMSSFSRLRRSDFRSFSELKILSTLHCVGGKANIRSATSLRSWGYNSLTTRCRSVGLRFNCFMMVSEFSFKICKPCFTIVLNISILADISNLTFLSKNSVFTWKYYIMSWNTRSTPETLSGAFKLSAPTLLSRVKKALAPLQSTLRSRSSPQHCYYALEPHRNHLKVELWSKLLGCWTVHFRVVSALILIFIVLSTCYVFPFPWFPPLQI